MSNNAKVENAFNIIEIAVRSYKGTYEEHTSIQAALQEIKVLIESKSTAVGVPNENTVSKSKGQEPTEVDARPNTKKVSSSKS